MMTEEWLMIPNEVFFYVSIRLRERYILSIIVWLSFMILSVRHKVFLLQISETAQDIFAKVGTNVERD